MQDIHSVDGEIRRRLRPHHHPTNQTINCPRCHSSNTKFCYYNNYNLSQPRHFCKGCHRYWTKGGVLRNVPVGGGCRNTKRSRPKSVATHPKSSSNSSSDSSSLTATATEASSSPTEFLNIHDFMNPSQGFDLEILEETTNCGFFSGIGSFTSLIMSSNDQLSFRFDNLLDPQTEWEQVAAGSGAVELKSQPAAESPLFVCGEDVKVEFSPAEWDPSSDEGLFDLHNGVDHNGGTQINPWSDLDHPTYIP